MTEYAISIADIRAARERIKPYVHETPILTSSAVDKIAGRQLFFKCENLQKTGAFKARGAINSVLSLDDEAATRGVVAHSSGNHAGGVAWAAQLRGIPAHIIVPSDTPVVKMRAVRAYGGNLIECERSMESREAVCKEVQESTGATFIAPYNAPGTMAGQGTIALELIEQVEDLDAVVIPISGGGLTSGVALALRALRPGLVVLAAEPQGVHADGADAMASKQRGSLATDLPRPASICDGLLGRMGDLTWPVVRDCVDEVLPVTEEGVVDAMQVCFERLKIVVEPSAAAPLAAVLSPQFLKHPVYSQLQRVALVVSGGNVDLSALGLWDALRAQVAANAESRS